MARDHTYDQHFLKSPRVVAELIGHSNVRKNDVVYDLGAGSGVIASVLARRCKQVFAVEIEPRALQTLRRNLAGIDNVTIIEKSMLEIHPNEPYKIFANIPFSLSADVVRTFTREDAPPKAMYLIVQKQFGRKLVPGDDHFTSQLGAEIAPWFVTRIRKPLRKSDFTPPPNVDTVLLEIKPRETPLLGTDQRGNYQDLVAQSFQRQKFFASLKKPFSPELRPSELTPEQWVHLYNDRTL